MEQNTYYVRELQPRTLRTVCMCLVSSLGTVFALVALLKTAPARGPAMLAGTARKDVCDQGLVMWTYNSYTLTEPLSQSPWTFNAEPHRESVFKASPTLLSSDFEYRWRIDGLEYYGQTCSHTFTSVGRHAVILSLVKAHTQIELCSNEFSVMVKYVRREIRTLTHDDRTAFLRAMHTIYIVDDDVGKALYGEEYKSHTYFVAKHLRAAADKACDHWHDNAGIYTNHMAFSLEFEKVLQVINPSIALPYWDFVQDVEVYGNAFVENAIVFDDDWFGVGSPDNPDHSITSGRWASVSLGNASDRVPHNPWGLMRSPWNTNACPFFTRSKLVLGDEYSGTLPDCATYANMLRRETLAEILSDMNGASHGPIHVFIGGHWGNDDEVFDSLGFTGATKFQVLLIMKALWRMGYVRCPSTCDNASECSCTCPTYLTGDRTPYEIMAEDADVLRYVAQDASKVKWDSSAEEYYIEGKTIVEQHELWEKLYNALCSFGEVGEMFTSAAPADPLFWVVHPTIDRVIHWRRLNLDAAPLDETFEYLSTGITASNTGVVCNWAGVDDTHMPTCSSGVCSGHSADDVIQFKGLINDNDVPTNVQFYDFLNPRNELLPYQYDNFLWEFCEARHQTFEF